MSNLGQRIRAARKAAGLTSAQLAQLVQRTPQYIRLIECGGATPSMQTTLALACLFPDEDSAEWLWLLLTDLWGEEAVTVMQQQCRAALAGEGPGALGPFRSRGNVNVRVQHRGRLEPMPGDDEGPGVLTAADALAEAAQGAEWQVGGMDGDRLVQAIAAYREARGGESE